MEDLIKLMEECSAAFRQTGEYRMLQTYSARETRFTFDERLAISKSVEQSFTPLFDRIKADIPTLSDTDLLFCALSTQGFETVAIAECFSVTKEAVRVRKYRLREKLDDKWFTLLFGEQKRYSSESVTLHASKADTAPTPTAPIPSAPSPKSNHTGLKHEKKKTAVLGSSFFILSANVSSWRYINPVSVSCYCYERNIVTGIVISDEQKIIRIFYGDCKFAILIGPCL